MDIKELIDNKKVVDEYFENERVLVDEIKAFILKVVRDFDPESADRNYFISVEFRDEGVYGAYEVEVTSVADYLTDEVIGALVRDYDLIVTYKCSQTGFNMATGEVSRQLRVYFRYAGDELAEIDEDVIEEVVDDVVDDGEE